MFYMETINQILPYAQVVVSVLLIITILMQKSQAGLGGAFGADNFSSEFHTRRGIEKFLFNATIVLAIAFVSLAIVSFII